MIKKLLFTLLAIFGFTLLFSGESFADSPSYTISSDPGTTVYLCSNTPGLTTVFSVPCTDYSYLNVELTPTSASRLQLWYSTNKNFPLDSSVMSTFSIKIPSTLTQINLSSGYFVFSDGGSMTFSLSDTPIGSIVPTGSLSISENGTYDVTNYASAVVNIPTETVVTDLPPYSALVVDSFWKYHVAIAGGLASIFAIFVVYRIIKSRLR